MLKKLDYTKKKAFTLSELLIALGVIGILTAILMPIVFSLMPNQNVLMAKRAFYTTETVISDLLNDTFCYPKTLSRIGLDDGKGYLKCKKWGGEENIESRDNENSADKLVTMFADRLDLKGSITTNGTKKSFKTKDGMIWTFSNFKFVANNPESYALLTVDVNGDKEPNCGQSSTSGQCEDKNRKKSFDRFTMRIFARGRIQILDCWAVQAAKIDKKLVGDEDITNCEDTDKGTDTDECENAPTSAEDICCNDIRWKNSEVCNSCVAKPTSAEDYCCTEESNSSWIGTEPCDPCTYKTPTGPNDECCAEGHKWHGTSVCDICSNQYSHDCCLTKKNSLSYGDKCCEHNDILNSVPACRNQKIIITPKFYVSTEKPKDANSWGKIKISSESTITNNAPFDITIKYVRGCPSGIGCGNYGEGMSCTINEGETSCKASEEFVTGTFPYKFLYTKPDKQKADFTGFKPTYQIPDTYQDSYSVKFEFPRAIEMY